MREDWRVTDVPNNSSLQEVDDGFSFVAGSDAGIACGYVNELEDVGDDADPDPDAGPTSSLSSAPAGAGRSSSGERGERGQLRLASTLAA